MGQQTGAPKFSGIDEGSFLSPEDSAGILSSLEEADQKLLGATASVPYDDGVFISPEEIDVQVGAEEAERYQPEAQLQHKPETQFPAPQPRRTTTAGAPGSRNGESMQSDLLSRISGELRSIKAEIGTLKSNYDTMISTASQPHRSRPQRQEARDRPFPTVLSKISKSSSDTSTGFSNPCQRTRSTSSLDQSTLSCIEKHSNSSISSESG